MCEFGCIFLFGEYYAWFCIHKQYEFDKNADSIIVCVSLCTLFTWVSLATTGVCVFCASASVGAFFVFGGDKNYCLWICGKRIEGGF